jgi:hypothetical protein
MPRPLPLPPATAAVPSSPPHGTWRTWASLVLVIVGILLLVTSTFLPWIEISIHRTFTPPRTDITYTLWDLPVWGCFPLLVGFLLPVIIWTLLQRRARRRHLGRVQLVLLCFGGVVGTFLFLLVAGLSAAPFAFVPWRGVSTYETLLIGGWIFTVGYGLLLVGTLLLGLAPASREAVGTPGDSPPPSAPPAAPWTSVSGS